MAATIAGACTGVVLVWKAPGPLGVCMMVLCFMLGLFSAAHILLFEITLYSDRLEWRGTFKWRTIQRDQISGWRILPVQGSRILELAMHHSSNWPVQIPLYFVPDAAFAEWLGAVPNLDEKEQAESKAEIENNPAFGMSKDERLASVDRARIVTRSATGLVVFLIAWAIFAPLGREAARLALIAAPWALLLAVWGSRGRIRLNEVRNDRHPSILLPCLLTFPVLGLFALADCELLFWRPVIFPMIAYGLLLSAFALAADASLRNKLAVGVFVIVISMSFGPVIELNMLVDNATPTLFRYVVREKWVTRGKHASYNIAVDRTSADSPDIDTTHVSRAVYARSNVGDPFCIALHEGALSIPWFKPARCPSATR